MVSGGLIFSHEEVKQGGWLSGFIGFVFFIGQAA